MSAKEFYRHYTADDNYSDLSRTLINYILQYEPDHALEFGSGSGKNIAQLLDAHPENNGGFATCGLDISVNNLLVSRFRNNNDFLILGDETNLRHLCNFDVVFTVSVLDHIENVDGIIEEFKRIANKVVFLAETNDVPGKYYYPHDYESYGFEKLSYTWKSDGDGATYHIWRFVKS